jgi:hypothetical protein
VRYEVPSDLPKLGTRPYIQGGSIFNEILAVCDRLLGPEWLRDAVITSFKLQRESLANGRFVVSDGAIEEVDANATLVARGPTRHVFVYYVDEGGETRREPYDEESYYRVVQIDPALRGEFILPRGRPRTDFMRGVVGANKLLHQKTDRFRAQLTHIQFLYLKSLDAVCLLNSAEECRLSISNASVQDHEAEVWTINRVAVHGESFRSEFRICYRAAKQPS